MEKEYNLYDCLQSELFEILLPRMLFTGTRKEQEDFFRFMLEKKQVMIHDLFEVLCKNNHVPYPYRASDFEVEMLERGGISFLQILIPKQPESRSDILRVYLLFMEGNDGRCIKKYFVIRRLDDGTVFILHITPGLKGILGKELTDCLGDMEKEYLELARDFVAYWVQDTRAEKKKKKKGMKYKKDND